MTPDEANVLRYLLLTEYRNTHEIARHFRLGLPVAELRMRSLLAHGQVEEDAKRYYRITELGRKELMKFDEQYRVKPFDGSRRPI